MNAYPIRGIDAMGEVASTMGDVLAEVGIPAR
jgi:hypothetical protein